MHIDSLDYYGEKGCFVPTKQGFAIAITTKAIVVDTQQRMTIIMNKGKKRNVLLRHNYGILSMAARRRKSARGMQIRS